MRRIACVDPFGFARLPCIILRALGFIPSITPEGVPDKAEFPVTAGVAGVAAAAELESFSVGDAELGEISLVLVVVVAEDFPTGEDSSFISLLI